MIFDKTIDSTVEWIGFNGKSRDHQVKEKAIELGVASNMLAMFPNDTQEDDCATSDEELMSLHGDSDDENLKRSTIFNPSRDLEDPKFKFALNMIFSNSKEFKWAVEVSSTIIDSVLSMQSSSSFITEQNVNQLNQPRVPREQLRSSAFILEEIGEHSREGTRPFFIERTGKQCVSLSRLQETLSQSSKIMKSDPQAKKKNVPLIKKLKKIDDNMYMSLDLVLSL